MITKRECIYRVFNVVLAQSTCFIHFIIGGSIGIISFLLHENIMED